MHNTTTIKLKQLNGYQPSFICAFPTVTCQNIFQWKRFIASVTVFDAAPRRCLLFQVFEFFLFEDYLKWNVYYIRKRNKHLLLWVHISFTELCNLSCVDVDTFLKVETAVVFRQVHMTGLVLLVNWSKQLVTAVQAAVSVVSDYCSLPPQLGARCFPKLSVQNSSET